MLSYFAVLVSISASTASATRPKPVTEDCIQIIHAGDQDRPVDSFRLCPGEAGKSRAEGFLGQDWTFEFDKSTFGALEEFVEQQGLQNPPVPGPMPFGTFSVSWGPKGARASYIVKNPSSCCFLVGIMRVALKVDDAAFRRIVGEMIDRLRCTPGSPRCPKSLGGQQK